jgi:hypothetical protein
VASSDRRHGLEAYRRVRANQGAAAIDDESIEVFEANLRGNLYTLWNRMAEVSGAVLQTRSHHSVWHGRAAW